MKTTIEFKSALLGLMIGAGAVFALGAGTAGNEIGHYQISAGQGTAITLDTKTGQAWCYSPVATSGVRSDGNFFDRKQ